MDYRLPMGTKGTIFFVLASLLYSLAAQGQSMAQRKLISTSYDHGKLSAMISEWESEEGAIKAKLNAFKASKGIQGKETTPEGDILELFDLGSDGTPLYYTALYDAVQRTSSMEGPQLGLLPQLGIDGSGMEVGIWDSGVALAQHQEFDDRALISDGSPETTLHATLVTGTLISSGVQPNARGSAHRATARIHDWGRDKIEVAEAAAQGLLLSNHSYGILTDRVPDWYFGAYIEVSRDWDRIMYNAPYYLMVTAAGNAQQSGDNASPNFGRNQEGFDLLLGFTTSKNGLTVAGAITEMDPKGQLLEGRVAQYSSFGPTDDGRIKPDLAGNGSNILSTSSASKSSYQLSSGTSMATPGVTGSLLLLQQYHEELRGHYMKAASLKGIALHTAHDVGEKGPDYKMGWGVIDTGAATELLQNLDYTSTIKEERLRQGETLSWSVEANGLEPLTVSLSWTDPEGVQVNSGTLNDARRALVNDLDIRIIGEGEVHLPWKLDPAKAGSPATHGDNQVDPYERIEIPNAAGTYTITMSHKGELSSGQQDFSLIVSGARLSNCSLQIPSDLALSKVSPTGASLVWGPLEDTLFELQYKSLGADSWNTELLWDPQGELEDLELGTVYLARVRSVCSDNAVSEFGETLSFEFRGTDTQAISMGPLEHPRELKLSLLPNPTTDFLSLGYGSGPYATYSIVSSSGIVVKKGKLEGRLDVSTLSSGLYVLVVQDLSGVRSGKFYKS